MHTNIEDQKISPGGASLRQVVEAGWDLGSSSFTVQLMSDLVTVHLADGHASLKWDSAVNSSGLAAPGIPLPLAPDTVYLFSGNNIGPTLLNSGFGANLPAIKAWIRKNPLKIGAITINDISDDATIRSSYCAASPLSPTKYFFNLVLDLDGTVDITVENDTGAGDITASIYLQVLIDYDNQSPNITVSEMQFSVSRFNSSGVFFTFLRHLFGPIISPYLLNGYHIAGALNHIVNKEILTYINKELHSLISSPSSSPLSDNILRLFFALGSQGKQQHHVVHTPSNNMKTPIGKQARSDIVAPDPAKWMSSPTVQNKTLLQLHIPSTHDSGTYGLTLTLSQMLYDDIKILGQLRPGVAPANGLTPFSNDTFYLGDALYTYVLQTIKSVSIAQDLSVLSQLKNGIRMLDLRVYQDTRDGLMYIHHGLRGPLFTEVLQQIQTFMQSVENGQELVFVMISHNTYLTHDHYNISVAVKLFQQYLGKYIYLPQEAKGVKYDIQNIRNKTLAQITNGKSKVLIMNIEGTIYPDCAFNTRPPHSAPGRTAEGLNTLDALIKSEDNGIIKNVDSLYQLDWTLTPEAIPDILHYVLSNLAGGEIGNLLRQFATLVNDDLPDFLEKHKKYSFSFVFTDWLEINNAVGDVIALNY